MMKRVKEIEGLEKTIEEDIFKAAAVAQALGIDPDATCRKLGYEPSDEDLQAIRVKAMELRDILRLVANDAKDIKEGRIADLLK